MKYRLGLVVPALASSGGVASVARFLKNVALGDGRFQLRAVSLSTSAGDAESLRLASPSTWWRGASITEGVWEGLPFTQVGAVGGELEFQRYRPRDILARTLTDCDVIQIVCGAPAWANALVNLGKPVAMHVATRTRVERRARDANPVGLLSWWRKGMTEITDRMDDNALRCVDAIQVMNPWMLDYARETNLGRKIDIRYAPPGIDADVFRPLGERRVQPTDAYILCVGRLDDPRKNPVLLLEAYGRLPEALQRRVRLVLAGSSEPNDEFWSRVTALGLGERVRFVARPGLDALIRLYQEASVVVSPSHEEGFGVVLLEAMACGIPVISTRSGGPDGIITDGDDGYLVPLSDAPTMSARLRQLLEDEPLNARMGVSARRTIERRFDQRVAGEVFVEIWERLLSKATGRV